MYNTIVCMVNWTEVEAEIGKGKGEKASIKCTPAELVQMRDEIAGLKEELEKEKENSDQLNYSLKDLNSVLEKEQLKGTNMEKEISSLKGQLESLKNDIFNQEIENELIEAANQLIPKYKN